MHRIEAEVLIPGHGAPVRDGVVVLDGSRIGYAGPARTAPPAPGTPATRVTAVMPGMWECHGHFLGTRSFDLGQLPLEPEALRGARCARDLRAALDAGITSVRWRTSACSPNRPASPESGPGDARSRAPRRPREAPRRGGSRWGVWGWDRWGVWGWSRWGAARRAG